MEKINIDTIYPFPADEYENKFIISIRDCYFTRFVEFYPVSDTSSEKAAKSLLSFMGRYGTPSEILSDKGS